jgi:hypothetical protein
MPRVRWMVLVASLAVGAAVATSCATYRQDLDRGRRHYDENQYEAALALFRVLELDLDSFSPAEQAQYAYLRGMTDYRLAGIAQPGSAMKDPKQEFRDNARHWLGVAASIEKASPGGLGEDEKKRLDDALIDLNHDVYGGADVTADGGAAGGEKAGGEKPKDNEKP